MVCCPGRNVSINFNFEINICYDKIKIKWTKNNNENVWNLTLISQMISTYKPTSFDKYVKHWRRVFKGALIRKWATRSTRLVQLAKFSLLVKNISLFKMCLHDKQVNPPKQDPDWIDPDPVCVAVI